MKKLISWLNGIINCVNYTEASIISYGIVENCTIGYSANMSCMISRMDLSEPMGNMYETNEEFE